MEIAPPFFLSLFFLYLLSKNDFVLVRKQVDLRSIFNVAFLMAGIAVLVGRLFYIISTGQIQLLSPVVFFHFLKFPGISFLGILLGGIVALPLLVKEKEALARMYDIVGIAFLPVLFFGTIVEFRLSAHFFISFLILILFSLISLLLSRMHRNFVLKDGSVFLIICAVFALLEIVIGIFAKSEKIIFQLSLLQLISLVLLVSSALLLLKNESIVS